MTALEAVFEDGVLKPTKPLDLPQGTHVSLYIVESVTTPRPENPADLIAEIANMPEEAGPPFTARDHDRVLYGKTA